MVNEWGEALWRSSVRRLIVATVSLCPCALFFPGPELIAQEMVLSDPSVDAAADAYTRGSELRRSGLWAEALELWDEASEGLTATPDPRIAISFVEVAVEHEASEWFPLASQFLLWGFSGQELEPHRTEVLAELARVRPLVGDSELSRYYALEDSATERIALELRRFWIEKDPTPTSVLNERLIEHWQRILHARAHFRFTHDSPYDTDDRGTIFVKFGEPDRSTSGMLGASEVELQIRVRSTEARQSLRRYDTHPQFEVWVYEGLNPDSFTYFLFGNEEGRGRFRLVDGVHDLIPPEARNRASARYTPGGIPATHYLELFYYEDLSALGGRFARRFAELSEIWNLYTERQDISGRTSPPEGTLDASSAKFQMRDRSEPEAPPVLPVKSDFEGEARDQIVVQMVRVLRDDDPRLVVMVLSAARLDVQDRSGLRRQRLEAPGFETEHTLIVRDTLLTEVGRLIQRATSSGSDISTFELRHVDRPMLFTIAAETVLETDSVEGDDATDSAPAGSHPGQAHLTPPPPLNTEADHLELSDLATGVAIPETIDGAALPFPLLPGQRLWLSDPLRVYLEVYHLAMDPTGQAHFRADFRVVALQDDGSVDESKTPVTLGVELQSGESVFSSPFDIALRDHSVGHYRIEVQVTDLVRGETRSRQAALELIG